MKNTTIEYQAMSRGYFLNITIHDEDLSIIDKQEGKSRDYKLSKKDWKELADLYQEINVKKLSEYKAPTEKRFYDGAAIANLRIIYDGKTYESQAFDHGTPPVEIEKFVNKIVSLATP
jgi:restriction endonuclease